MSPTSIFTLPRAPTSTGAGPSLLEEIEEGLRGGETVIPGNEEEDKKWAYKRSVPTVVLYDEQGLRLYDRITAHAPEYYLFNDELNLLKTHGHAIAQSMGFPSPEQDDPRQRHEQQPDKPWKPARWGDAALGKWNNGVNGEEGIGGGFERGWDVVELGAGALRKTAYLLTSLSSEVTPSDTPPITYHALDLSRPELHRVLGEMDEAFGAQLGGKVDCVGLHGDYEAGLQLIREGKLESLTSERRGRKLSSGGDSSSSSESPSRLVTPAMPIKSLDASPQVSAAHETDLSPLPSGLTESSEGMSCAPTDDAGTWSPIEDAASCQARPAHADPSPQPASTPSRPMHFMFLGSSLGNFPREAAAPFLASLPLRQGDTLLLGLDGRPAPGRDGRHKVEVAYNDPSGHTRAFEEHGWDVVRQELGLEGDEGVEFVGRYNETLGRHEAYFRSKAKQALHLPKSGETVTLEKDELLNIEWSYKYSLSEALTLFAEAGLRPVNSWKAPDSEYRLWVLERPMIHFNKSMDMIRKEKGESVVGKMKGVPSWEEWLGLWKLWDHITLDMISKEMLHTKPIDLRHICLFYLGHIPTFLDIHLTRMTNGYHSEPEHFKDIFERGIDPDVDDPTKIHSHSEVPTAPEEWPVLDEILAFRDRVRRRLRGIYDALESGDMAFSRHVGRVLFMTFEHEAMHAETLLYMLIQSDMTRPPTAIKAPNWEALKLRWAAEKGKAEIIKVEGGEVSMGHDDLEADDAKYPTSTGWEDHEFGWDEENPRLTVAVKPFSAEALPISNADYLVYLREKHGEAGVTKEHAPASWVQSPDGEWSIRTLYGPVSFDVGRAWPLIASKDEIDAYAKSKGGRLPTEGELRKLWEHEDGPRPVSERANVGFENWHPVPAAKTQVDHAGTKMYGHNGGVWEWTSTELKGYDGFVASELYPGYSSDFFDGKHFVVLGGSYATIPQMAGRKSFRNWYQGNYKFAWTGGRVVYDV